ncbi:MAG: aromatic amino acid ammonia-lyase [Crocinitomicaceae bacterium]
MDLSDIEQFAIYRKPLLLNKDVKDQLHESFNFLTDFSKDKIIYGINTGFGPMAQFKIDDDKLNHLQYNLIRSHSSGTGNVLDDESVRAVVVARLNNFLQGNSGISFEVVEQLTAFLKHEIYPEIYEHGGVGASGDLVQLAHLALNLIGEGYVRYQGVRRPTAEVLSEIGLQPLKIQLRDGLGLMNGTSCMTGIGAVNLIYAYRLLNWGIVSSTIINEIMESYDDSFSEGLNKVKLHPGQMYVAKEMRDFLVDSQMIKKREDLFSDNDILQHVEFKKKIQEYYSIRCVPQILGPVKETLDYARSVVENEMNSTNDNPIISVEDQNVYHGGNFHGDYVSLEMDKVKLVVTKMTMLAERQLNYLLNSKMNEQFPAFLNQGVLGLNFGIQGMQFTATSTTAENQMLSNPMYVHSISNNNDNQDIVSMGTNSAVITRKVINNGFQVMAIHMMAVCQAIDLLGEEKRIKLSPKTLEVYKMIRNVAPMITEDVPQFENIRNIIDTLSQKSVEL